MWMGLTLAMTGMMEILGNLRGPMVAMVAMGPNGAK